MAMFGFAWVEETDSEFLPAFDREDEDVLSLDVSHAEGAFPTLSVVIRNPRMQFLADGAPLWAWLSLDGAPLFFGRLVASPQDLQAETVTLSFMARPVGFDAAKRALAETLRVAPLWDPIWITAERREDPDVILESRHAAWHIDRTSLEVSLSDSTAGEDGTVVFSGSQAFYDSVRVSWGTTPLRRVKVDAVVSWDQAAVGTIDITADLVRAFKNAGSTGGRISSFTGQGLEEDWPQVNANLDGGWYVAATALRRVDGVSVRQRYVDTPVASSKPASADAGAYAIAALSSAPPARFYLWEFVPSFTLGYDVSRQRIEHVVFELEADVQSLVVDPGEDEAHIISVSSLSVSEPVDDGGAIPIGDVRRASYLKTDRGRQSLEYLIALARTKLLARARAVTVEFSVPLSAALDLSCRKSATVTDPRIPGGTATGKIVEYRLVASGDGTRLASVKIACTIGAGHEVLGSPGSPEYVDAGYVAAGYQKFDGASVEAGGAGGVVYEDYLATPIPDDGLNLLDLKAADVINSLTVINGETVQRALLTTKQTDIAAAVEALNAIYTEVDLQLVPLVGGPFTTEYAISISDAMIPETITL